MIFFNALDVTSKTKKTSKNSDQETPAQRISKASVSSGMLKLIGFVDEMKLTHASTEKGQKKSNSNKEEEGEDRRTGEENNDNKLPMSVRTLEAFADQCDVIYEKLIASDINKNGENMSSDSTQDEEEEEEEYEEEEEDNEEEEEERRRRQKYLFGGDSRKDVVTVSSDNVNTYTDNRGKSTGSISGSSGSTSEKKGIAPKKDTISKGKRHSDNIPPTVKKLTPTTKKSAVSSATKSSVPVNHQHSIQNNNNNNSSSSSTVSQWSPSVVIELPLNENTEDSSNSPQKPTNTQLSSVEVENINPATTDTAASTTASKNTSILENKQKTNQSNKNDVELNQKGNMTRGGSVSVRNSKHNSAVNETNHLNEKIPDTTNNSRIPSSNINNSSKNDSGGRNLPKRRNPPS